MSLPQQKFREIVCQILYSIEIGSTEDVEMTKLLMREQKASRKNIFEALQRAKEVISKKSEIDEIIRNFAKEYSLERIQVVEKNILRLSIFEMIYDQTVPPKVAIAEAIRLCRKFSNPEASSFVNAILDAIYQERLCKGK